MKYPLNKLGHQRVFSGTPSFSGDAVGDTSNWAWDAWASHSQSKIWLKHIGRFQFPQTCRAASDAPRRPVRVRCDERRRRPTSSAPLDPSHGTPRCPSGLEGTHFGWSGRRPRRSVGERGDWGPKKRRRNTIER